MNFYEEIEPIHELPSDDLGRFLDHAFKGLGFIWSRERDESLKDIHHEIDFDLQTIIHSIKKSLLYFYPTCEFDLSYVVDANEAMHYLDILEHSNPRSYGLIEGVRAIFKIYLQVGFYYPCDPQDIGLLDFKEMESAVLKYADIARFYYHERKMKEARPLIEEGKKRRKQLTAPKDKMNKLLLKATQYLWDKGSYQSAKHLMKSFPQEKEPLIIDGGTFFKEFESEDGNLKITLIEPDGKRLEWKERQFAKYYKRVKTLHDNC